MGSNQLVLHIGSCAHLLRAAHQDSHFSTAHLFEKLLLLRFGIRFVDKFDFRFRNASLGQLFPYVRINRKFACALRGGEVAKDKLRCFRIGVFFPYAVDILHAGVDLTAFFIWQKRIHHSLVESELASVVCDLEHIVNTGVYTAATDFLSPFSERSDHFLLHL